MTREEVMKLKKECEMELENKHRLEGQVKQLKTTLKEEFDCFTVADAKRLLKELEEQEKQLQESYEQLCKEYNEAYLNGEL